MKFVVKVNDRKCLLSAMQIEQLCELLHGTEYYNEKYVGTDKGTIGSSMSYVPVIEQNNVDEWFDAKVMRSDYIDTIKLTMKLEKT